MRTHGAAVIAVGIFLSLTGAPALVVFRPILYQDLRISASIPLHEALSSWRDQRDAIGLTALVFVAMILAAGGLAFRYLDRLSQARVAIAQSKATLDQALESMVSGFLLLDKNNCVVQWNSQFEVIFPWLKGIVAPRLPFRTVIEETVKHHHPRLADDEHARWVDQRLLRQQQPQHEPHEQVYSNGRTIQITERTTPDGGLVISYHDVTALRRASAEIENLAFYDPLTNLPNRRLLMDRMQQAIASSARSGQYGALLFLDLDHFKTLNDTRGHEVGDELLRQVAQRLRSVLGPEDVAGRIGADDFVLLLPTPASRDALAALADQVLGLLGQPYQVRGREISLSGSAGIVLYPDHGGQARLLARADAAKLAAKRLGGACYAFFEPGMETDAREQLDLLRDLRQAVARQELELFYQPKIDAASGQVTAAEALLRWRHPARGLIAPNTFIPLAERFGLMRELGRWVIDAACQQARLWRDSGLRMRVAINLSAQQLRQPDIVEQLEQALERYRIQPALLTCEITETVAMEDTSATQQTLRRLGKLGLHLSIDDFGTGYSSLSYLRQLPAEELKIDRAFVTDVDSSSDARAVVDAVVKLAHALGLRVVAEGVENERQRDTLLALGCDELQGFLYARPMSPQAILLWAQDEHHRPNPAFRPSLFGETTRQGGL